MAGGCLKFLIVRSYMTLIIIISDNNIVHSQYRRFSINTQLISRPEKNVYNSRRGGGYFGVILYGCVSRFF